MIQELAYLGCFAFAFVVGAALALKFERLRTGPRQVSEASLAINYLGRVAIESVKRIARDGTGTARDGNAPPTAAAPKKKKLYDEILEHLESEQGDWYIRHVLEAAAADLFKHYSEYDSKEKDVVADDDHDNADPEGDDEDEDDDEDDDEYDEYDDEDNDDEEPQKPVLKNTTAGESRADNVGNQTMLAGGIVPVSDKNVMPTTDKGVMPGVVKPNHNMLDDIRADSRPATEPASVARPQLPSGPRPGAGSWARTLAAVVSDDNAWSQHREDLAKIGQRTEFVISPARAIPGDSIPTGTSTVLEAQSGNPAAKNEKAAE